MKTERRHLDTESGARLASRLADGDPLAPRDLVEWHYAELYRYAFAMLRDGGAAEDSVHDAFERAFRALGEYSEKRLRAMMLRAWLYRITLNVVRNRIKKRKREVPVAEVRDFTESPGEHREEAMDALAALNRLPEKQRTAVALRYLQDLRYSDIAEATGWPESTAKTLARRGMERLRTEMDQGGLS